MWIGIQLKNLFTRIAQIFDQEARSTEYAPHQYPWNLKWGQVPTVSGDLGFCHVFCTLLHLMYGPNTL